MKLRREAAESTLSGCALEDLTESVMFTALFELGLVSSINKVVKGTKRTYGADIV